jgi:Flp pilus assembly protein TadD
MKHLSFVLIALLALSACQHSSTGPIDSLQGHKAAREKRLATAASDAIAAGKTNEALALYTKRYEETPKDKDVVLNYAQLLRKTGDAGKAAAVLSPFVMKGKETNTHADPLLLTEYAATEIALGKFDIAEEALDAVLKNDDAKELHADAYNLMGVSLDAQGRHTEAESMYSQSLQLIGGDPSSVMNNLGLCLANQGRLDESLTMLRKALLVSPDKQDIARNIKMVEDLRAAVVPSAPVKIKK